MYDDLIFNKDEFNDIFLITQKLSFPKHAAIILWDFVMLLLFLLNNIFV
jgi:hypothetical protein